MYAYEHVYIFTKPSLPGQFTSEMNIPVSTHADAFMFAVVDSQACIF